MKKKVASLLREYRKKRKLTGEDVVKELSKYNINVSSQTIYNYETNLRQPNADIFLYLCKIYGITSFDMFFSDGELTHNEDNPYKNLNEMGRAKADEYIEDLSGNPKYTEKIHIIKQAARDGTFTEIHATDSEIQEMLKNINELPDVDDDL